MTRLRSFGTRQERTATRLTPVIVTLQAIRYVLWNSILVIVVGCIVGIIGIFAMDLLGLLGSTIATILLVLAQFAAMAWTGMRLWKRW